MSTSLEPSNAPHPELEAPALNPYANGFCTGPKGERNEKVPCEKFYRAVDVSRWEVSPVTGSYFASRFADNCRAMREEARDDRCVNFGCWFRGSVPFRMFQFRRIRARGEEELG